jgi:dihydrofolate synthase / folylpolyglutamate synthase
MQFDEALSYLLSLGHETLAMKLGLQNTETLLSKLENPQTTFPSVQIAGTNGKGSTAVLLDSILRAADIRTGLYTSPHLVSITERIKVDGKEISPADFARLASLVSSTCEKLVSDKVLDALPTFFEQVTAIALTAFRDAKIDLAILETGLGGRLDATTCAAAKTVAITPVAMDHETYLGDTIEEVAGEKAAIIRPGVDAVIAPQPPAVREVIMRQCERTGVTPIFVENRNTIDEVTADGRLRVSFEVPGYRYDCTQLGLRGRHQIINAAVAVAVVEVLRTKGINIPRTAVVHGLERAEHQGRLELIPGEPPILLDGAHNPAGAQTLRDYLDEFARRPLTLVFGAMRDKKLREIGEVLFPAADAVVLTEIENPRTASVELLQDIASEFVNASKVITAKSSREALRLAREKTTAEGMICCAGSLYLIGEMRNTLMNS